MKEAMRLARFIGHCIRLRSIARARWVDAYEQTELKANKCLT